MISYLLFDVDNTLYRGGEATNGLGQVLSTNMTRFAAEFTGIPMDDVWEQRRHKLPTYGTTLTWLIKEHGLEDIEGYLDAVHPKDLSPFITRDDVNTARSVLDQIDLPASILTNGPAEHATRVLEYLGIADRFDFLFDLRSNGFLGKPHADAYSRALAKIGVPAGDTLFIDDVLQYLLPFRAMGGTVVHITDSPESNTDIPTIAHLSELVPICKERSKR